jgi:dynein heavy chain 2, cytosolic
LVLQALGRQVLVFNCDEEFDFQSMGRMFMGLLRCGAWGCFDEFNRLDEEVLSSVSQQIQLIQAALKAGIPEINLMGTPCTVSPCAGIFVTLNPAGKGYGGRSKLPDNLKALFRSVAMAAPDNEVIAEVLLLSEGFQEARQLALKVVALYDMAQKLLLPQQHYDWGLRSLKTVLSVSGTVAMRKSERVNACAPSSCCTAWDCSDQILTFTSCTHPTKPVLSMFPVYLFYKYFTTSRLNWCSTRQQ